MKEIALWSVSFSTWIAVVLKRKQFPHINLLRESQDETSRLAYGTKFRVGVRQTTFSIICLPDYKKQQSDTLIQWAGDNSEKAEGYTSDWKTYRTSL